jgi:hypothetical protein
VKTFSEFLAENWRAEKYSGYADVVHKHTVAGHNVETTFVKSDRQHNRWEAHFHVNHSNYKTPESSSSDDRMKILHHVHKTVNRFVKRIKPSSLEMLANSDEKHHLYGKFAKRLAKQHNGHHFDRGHGGHLVHFHWDKK